MPDDVFHAGDLTEEHLGLYVRTRKYEGRLRAVVPVNEHETHVQILLVDGDGPFLPVVPIGEPVEVTLDP